MQDCSKWMWQTATATGGHETRNEGNTFAAGGVALSTPGTTSALLTFDGLVPGQPRSSCIDVAYDGDLPAQVRLHAAFRSTAAGPDDSLASYVDVVVEETGEGAGTPCAVRRAAARGCGPVRGRDLRGAPGAALPRHLRGPRRQRRPGQVAGRGLHLGGAQRLSAARSPRPGRLRQR